MSNLSDAQTLATYNASGTAPGSVIQPTGFSETVTVVSGTPFQISSVRTSDLYINVNTSAALAISMGPTAAGTTVTVSPSQLTAVGLIHLRVPTGWYVVLTGTAADVNVTAVLE